MKLVEEPLRLFANDEHGHLKAEVTLIAVNDNLWSLNHTFVHPDLRGQGIAEELVAEAVAKARREKKAIVPSCSFAKVQFERKPEYADVWHK
ncbi:GNAT family N-acetyltransferase [Brochothrix campestris]|uniref:Putative acetyltransferase n=1 Tax=Brochothrix campestris FSL F6-1037 TaxID=1265861 RepID=W7D2K1_9LIST|nr:GNAT family N-acetyltransferase [Brochothrix campestris]EUJ42141.1 putative acetyltransferase [Brochothrix campestris FSL F6-1037]